MVPFDYFEQLGSRRYLFLEQLAEPRRNALRMQVSEGTVSEASVPFQIGGKSFGEAFPVEINPDCAKYELTWNSYVLYQVLNEIYGIPDGAAVGITRRLTRVYEKSGLLEFVLSGSGISVGSNARLLHFEVVCADHVIDVISSEAPLCRKISQSARIC